MTDRLAPTSLGSSVEPPVRPQVSLLSLTPRNTVLALSALVFLCLILRSLVSQGWGVIGDDPDDVMRLVQLQDRLDGQGWFDVFQTRLGPVGTDMHWSRLVDAPMLVLTALLTPFLGEAAALKAAITIWPPMVGAVLFGALMRGATHICGAIYPNDIAINSNTAVMAALLGGLSVLTLNRFLGGAIDHHNVQMAAFAVAVAWACDPYMKRRSGIVSGLAVALVIVTAAEIHGLSLIICASVAILWIWQGERAEAFVGGFGFAMAAGALAGLVLSIPLQAYGRVSCDSYSGLIAALCGLGAGGLALGTRLNRLRTWQYRGLWLTGLGTILAAILLVWGSSCLADPLGDLTPELRADWLNTISEAKSARLVFETQPATAIVYLIGGIAASIYAAIALPSRLRRKTPQACFALFLVLSLSLACLLMTVLQVRFYVYGILMLMLVLPITAARVRTQWEGEGIKPYAYLPLIIISVPWSWAIFPALFTQTANGSNMTTTTATPSEIVETCFDTQIIEALSVPVPGLVMLPLDEAPTLLQLTPQRAVAGNYHRGWQDIERHLHLTKTGNVRELREAGVERILFCALSRSPDPSRALHLRTIPATVPDGMSEVLRTDSALLVSVD